MKEVNNVIGSAGVLRVKYQFAQSLCLKDSQSRFTSLCIQCYSLFAALDRYLAISLHVGAPVKTQSVAYE